MRIEAFSRGKDRADAGTSEDQFLVLPGRGYAVIDGVSDLSGQHYVGQRAGRVASRVVQQAVTRFLLDPAEAEAHPARLIAYVSAELRAAGARYGVPGAALGQSGGRFAATLTLTVDLGESFRFVLVGDSGLRLNGHEITIVDSGLDRVTAALRQEAYRVVQAAGGSLNACRQVGRACAFYGAGAPFAEMRPWLDVTGLAALRRAALDRCRAQFPHVPQDHLERLLDRGIAGQGAYQNTTTSPLGYAVLDGSDVPMDLVRVVDRPRTSIQTIELFTDGYFEPGATPEVDAWEAAFEEVERVDPEKIGRYASVKGSTPETWTDDRTVVIVSV
jgi:Protein phosphatase 2C